MINESLAKRAKQNRSFSDYKKGSATAEFNARGSMLVVGGRGPVWRYGMAFHQAHGSAASVVATYDPRLGEVVVASHSPDYRDGDVVADVDWPF